jgi:Restriction endonuclease
MAKFCPECGTRLPIETAKFCHECGTSLSLLSCPPPDVVQPQEPVPVPQEPTEPQVNEPVPDTYAEVEDAASDVQLSVNISELGKKLEEHVEEMFRGLGYRTQRNVRFGQNGPRPYAIDVVAQKDEELVAIECHNDPQPAGREEVTQFSRKIQWLSEDTDATWHGIFIAYGNFTPEAESVAQGKHVETWGRDEITEKWIQYFSGQMGGRGETLTRESAPPITTNGTGTYHEMSGAGIDVVPPTAATIAACEVCGATADEKQLDQCPVCNKWLCQDHSVECSSCRARFCLDDATQICQNCQLPVCSGCTTECPICHNIVGKNHLHACATCGITGCEKCVKTVGVFKKTKSCRACFEKGNETVQRLKQRETDIIR